MKITPHAQQQADAIGVVVDVAAIDREARAIAPTAPRPDEREAVGEAHAAVVVVRLGRPSRARIVVDAARATVLAVLPSSPRAQPGVPERRHGDPVRKAARDQERWERKRGGRTHGLSPEGETPPTQMRLGADVLAALDDLVAAATARGERATRSSVVRELVLRARA